MFVLLTAIFCLLIKQWVNTENIKPEPLVMGEGLFGLNKKLEQKTDESWTVALIRGVNKVRKETWNSAKGAPRLLYIIIIRSTHVESIVLLQKSVKRWLGEIG